MATQPQFASVPRVGKVILAAGVNAIGGTGISDLFAAGTVGSRVDAVNIKGAVAIGSSTVAATVRIYYNDGSSNYLLHEEKVPATPVTATATNPKAIVTIGLNLPTGTKLTAQVYAASGTDAWHVIALGGDL